MKCGHNFSREMHIATGTFCNCFIQPFFFYLSLLILLLCACIHLELRMLISNSNFPIKLSCPFCHRGVWFADPSLVFAFEVTTQSNLTICVNILDSFFFHKKEAQTRLHQIKIYDYNLRYFLHFLSRHLFIVPIKKYPIANIALSIDWVHLTGHLVIKFFG